MPWLLYRYIPNRWGDLVGALKIHLLFPLTYPRIDGHQRTWDIHYICRRTAAARLQYNMLYTIVSQPIIIHGRYIGNRMWLPNRNVLGTMNNPSSNVLCTAKYPTTIPYGEMGLVTRPFHPSAIASHQCIL